ncbi:triose-phosphate isomerase [candidate division WOR-3 bacterium]|uniref:Triosephosphate isomerase n=1 Tax=candidate division WOR-3 bacterium TaxID=2052148 RepID=A0A938BUH9_UNCW3|nr:triose-phosphate isomerase [candidate division WOR-3 bacterium]
MSGTRIPLVAGNWKMNKGPGEARAFAQSLLKSGADSSAGTVAGAAAELAVFPSFTALPAVADILRGTFVAYGGQNCHWETSGAFTGEISPAFLAELGCRYVLVGHSERRTLFGDTDDTCRKKVLAALAAGLEPILCCGESLSERESEQTMTVIERQLHASLLGLPPAAVITVAYEPVWAIGTGRSATPGQAGEVHTFVRRWLRRNLSPEAAERTRLLYGGSVKPDNFVDLLKQPDVDGALIGGASLEGGSFRSLAGSATSYLTGLI